MFLLDASITLLPPVENEESFEDECGSDPGRDALDSSRPAGTLGSTCVA